MSLICNLQNLNLAFGEKKIFSDAKCSINQGDKVGLIGLNGHGKSTLFKILAGEVTPDVSNPPFIFDKNNENFSLFYIPQELEIEAYKDLTIQNFYLSFYPKLYQIHQQLEKVQAELAIDYSDEKLLNKQQDLMEKFEHNDGWNLENAYSSYLTTFELKDQFTSIDKLSGGEQRKIALSIGLSAKANLILWDEPTNHLDVETIEKFEDELNKSQNAYIVISHDRYLLNHVTNKIIHIERGTITSFQGTYLEYLEYLEEREKELSKNLDKLENRHRRELAWMRQGIKARGTRSKKRVEGFHNIKDNISDLKARSRKVVDLSLTHSGRKSKQLIEIKEGYFSYGDKSLFEDLEISIFKNDKIALIGPNGAGKTTLINILKNELALSSGKYKALDQLNVVSFDQKRETLNLESTPFEIVGDGQDFVHLADGNKKHVIAYLENFLFTKDQIHRPIYTLSGGEKNRLQLALFMKQSADLWIFDEPTNDLDIETIELLEEELKNYKAAVIIIGHDRAFLDNVCKTTWLVNEKNIEIFEGGYSQVAPYLHALELEKKMATAANSKVEAKQKKTKEKKATNKEKMRWENIEAEIEAFEKSTAQLKQEISELNFDNKEEHSKFESLSLDLKSHEASLAKLYQEWDELSMKMAED